MSSFERLLLRIDLPPRASAPPLRKGRKCPQCGKGKLGYNPLLQLECPQCGFVNHDGGGCT